MSPEGFGVVVFQRDFDNVTDVCIVSLSQVFINCGSDFAIGIPIFRLTRLLGTILQFLVFF